jgi:hypothetical protein
MLIRASGRRPSGGTRRGGEAVKLLALVIGTLLLVVGALVGAGLGLRFYATVAPRVTAISWLVPQAPGSPAPSTAQTAPVTGATPTPILAVASCTLWSADGQWNVTVYGDHAEGSFAGYCAAAPKSKFAMHPAGPAAGTTTCDMSDRGERFVFQDTVTRSYVPCDRATPFFEAIRAVA